MSALVDEPLEESRALAASLIRSTGLPAALTARGQERLAIYERVFEAFPAHHGKTVSRRARDSLGLTASTLVYGEIEFASFYETLEKIRLKYGVEVGVMQAPGRDVFVDLGSGAGKPSVAAAVSFPFRKCVGVELVQALVDASREAGLVYDAHRPDDGADLEFHCSDLCDLEQYDWSLDATVVFANSTCFDEDLMDGIARAADRLPKDTFVVTLTRKLPSAHFLVCESQLYQMSWGGATVFIQRKIDDPV